MILRTNGTSRKNDAIFLVCAFLLLGSLSAFRYSVGTDYSFVYAPSFEEVLADPVGFGFSDSRFEPGFILLEKVIAYFFQNYQMLFIVTGYLSIGLFMFCYWKYSSDVVLSVLLFLLLSEFYCTMNFMRQSLAGVIALFALHFIKKRKFLPFLIFIILAAMFHKSAILLIPIFFLCMIPFNWITLAGYAIVTVVLYFNTQRIMAFVTQYWYSSYSSYNIHVMSTFEWPFTIAMFVEFLIVLCGIKKLKADNPENNTYLHYAFLAFFFTLMGTRHSILDRLSLYFEFAFPLSIPLVYRLFRQDFYSWKNVLSKHGTKTQRQKAGIVSGLLVLIFGGGLAIHQYALYMDHHGVVPYRTIINQPFYEKYVRELRTPVLVKNETSLKPTEEPEDEPISFSETPVIQPAETPPDLPAEADEGAPVELALEDYLALDGGA